MKFLLSSSPLLLLLLSIESCFSLQLNRNIKNRLKLSLDVGKANAEFALLFDCDGVIVETEELHRLAYNGAFQFYGLKLKDGKEVNWDTKYYDILQNTVGGGKPKMKYYFNNNDWPISSRPYKSAPKTENEQNKLVDMLQDKKTEIYKKIIDEVATARPGVLELMDEAIADPRINVGICSAATKEGFVKLVDSVVGKDRLSKLNLILAGDDVKEKKPSPMIYNIARESLGMAADKCVVIEDSMVGLRAAKSANMKCIITYTSNTANEDFYGEGADAKVADLNNVKLKDIFEPLRNNEQTIFPFRDQPKSNNNIDESKVEVKVAENKPELTKVSGWTPHYTILKK